MENLRLSFEIPPDDIYATVENALEITTVNGMLQCSLFYDYDPTPLKLCTLAKEGDRAELILMPHRTELWINGTIADEEWPAGNMLFIPGNDIEGNIDIAISEYVPLDADMPSVTGSFENAEGWYPGGGVFVGDCMPYTDEGRYHVLFLKDRHHHTSKWNLGAHQWEHISTTDFVHWDKHPMAVEITHKNEGSICTGSHIKKDGVHYLFYTIRRADHTASPICRSISYDGYHFEKDTGFSFVLSAKYNGETARDPKVIYGQDGLYHMILTTRLTEENLGCLAHLVSSDLTNWREKEKPIYINHDETEPECPDYIFANGYYYLIYSLEGKAYYMYSTRPFDNWQTPRESYIPCSSVPKGALWNGKIVFTGFKRIDGYAGSMTFRKAVPGENGELIF